MWQIDPKRAIPREEQERTSKIFVGGVSQDANEEDFRNFFKKFGRVVDATLMMDKDTGRPRGFGFVTFDGDAAVDATLAQPLSILGKPIEVKRAQPRGAFRDEDRFGRRGDARFGHRMEPDPQQQIAQNSGISPAMMAQYWQRMQQYFQIMQQNLSQAQGMPGPMNMGSQPSPAMMQQMMMANRSAEGAQQPNVNPMNPGMMPQMQMQAGFGGNAGMMNNGRMFNPQDQLAFEQQKFEQQAARRMQQVGGYSGQGGPTSWDGMYDDIPQPAMPPSGPANRMGPNLGRGGMANRGGRGAPPQAPTQPSNAPANAPTGPKNAGKPGANYRGGGRGHRGGARYDPYGRG